VAVRQISEVHVTRSLARPVAFDPVGIVREGVRFALINICTRLKLANAAASFSGLGSVFIGATDAKWLTVCDRRPSDICCAATHPPQCP
jgi:hypothetical protein